MSFLRRELVLNALRGGPHHLGCRASIRIRDQFSKKVPIRISKPLLGDYTGCKDMNSGAQYGHANFSSIRGSHRAIPSGGLRRDLADRRLHHLTLPPEKFSYLIFIVTLILIWPVAVLYLVSLNNQRGRSVCLRVTSQGYVEASGYTLGVIERERKRRRLVAVIALCVCALIILLIIIGVYLARSR